MSTVTDIRAADPTRRRRRQHRIIVFGLSGEEWDTLIEMAVSESRDPEQQARWVVLQAIRLFAEEQAS